MNEEINIKKKFEEANYFFKQNNFVEAEKLFKKILKNHPERISILRNLSLTSLKLGKKEEAIYYISKVVELSPYDLNYKIDLCEILIEFDEIVEAKKIIKKLIFEKKKNSRIYSNYLKIFQNIHQPNLYVSKIENFINTGVINEKKVISRLLFNYGYLGTQNEKRVSDLLIKFNKNCDRFFRKVPFKKNNKTRIGFISANFRSHPVGYFLYSICKELEKRFELFFFYNSKFKDKITYNFTFNIRSSFINISELNDVKTLEIIRKNNIDILFDLDGHTANNRLNLFANKPAQIQISWIGYLARGGLDEMDYIIMDKFVSDKTEFFSEKRIEMSKIWACFSAPEYFNLTFAKRTPCKKNKFFVFYSPNTSSKVSDQMIYLWSKILKKNRNSKLSFFLNSNSKFVKKIFYRKFKNNGIEENQLIFESPKKREDSLNYYNQVDMVLDTFPYNGGTTSFESSYMGVPILTKEGNTFLSKCGESINNNLMLQNFISKTEDEYIEKALYFSENIDKLNLIRKDHFEKVLKSSLFDSKNFADELSEKLTSILN